jgi:uncharacterized membrane protein
MAQDQLTTARLQAFSDGVIAVIITIMVLDLKVPAPQTGNLAGLHQVLPLILVYLLSFVQVGIYWVNHHYLIDDVKQISHGILWSNLIFLFCLSLFPFATKWVGERGISSFSVSLYAATATLPAMSWTILSAVIRRSFHVQPAGSPLKQVVSSALNLGAIAAAFVSPYLALAMLSTVAALWLIPPRRIREETCQVRSATHGEESR